MSQHVSQHTASAHHRHTTPSAVRRWQADSLRQRIKSESQSAKCNGKVSACGSGHSSMSGGTLLMVAAAAAAVATSSERRRFTHPLVHY